MSILAKINNAIDDGLINKIFTHIRNYLICITIIAAGIYELKISQHQLLPSLVGYKVVGIIAILLGFLLALLNLYGATYKLSKNEYPLKLNILLIGAYLIITLRILEIIWYLRFSI
jgi:hypothetical protein